MRETLVPPLSQYEYSPSQLKSPTIKPRGVAAMNSGTLTHADRQSFSRTPAFDVMRVSDIVTFSSRTRR
jgi:hypothetical protein